jgi:hypothetical protein
LTHRVPTEHVLTSGNVPTLENKKNPSKVCDCNPREVTQVLSLLLQFHLCQNSQSGWSVHVLPCTNYENPDISCTGFTELI